MGLGIRRAAHLYMYPLLLSTVRDAFIPQSIIGLLGRHGVLGLRSSFYCTHLEGLLCVALLANGSLAAGAEPRKVWGDAKANPLRRGLFN